MKRTKLIELLDLHAQGMKDGESPEGIWARADAVEDDTAHSLLRLAQRVRAALAPVEPRPEYVAHLQAQLKMQARAALPPSPAERRLVWEVGRWFYFAGVVLVAWRIVISVVSVIAAILTWRAARPALAKVRAMQ
jgi:hypothetical protein